MTAYKCSYAVDEDAKTPEEAAIQALEDMATHIQQAQEKKHECFPITITVEHDDGHEQYFEISDGKAAEVAE